MKIYIAEDEPLAAAKLKVFLEKIGEGGDISHFDNGVSALAAITDGFPDLLFLDIQMPGLTGMQLLERLSAVCPQDSMPAVIITSAYDQYAIDSFAFDVTDYLLKPYTIERLRLAVEKAKKRIRLSEISKQQAASTITIRHDGITETLMTADIISIESVKDYVRITVRDGRHLTFLATMNSILAQLPTERFARVHRSYIINCDMVKAIGTQSVTMTDGTEIAIGKTYRDIINQLDHSIRN